MLPIHNNRSAAFVGFFNIIVWSFCKDFIAVASDLTMFSFKMAFGFVLGNSSTVEMNLSTA